MDALTPGTHERLIVADVMAVGSNRSFGIVFSVLFTFLGLGPVLRGRPVRGWALVVAAAFLLAALALPRMLEPLNRVWSRFGLALHACISPVIMGLVFYTTMTPIGLVRRWLGADPLHLRLERDAATYWIERHPPGPAPETMPRQF